MKILRIDSKSCKKYTVIFIFLAASICTNSYSKEYFQFGLCHRLTNDAGAADTLKKYIKEQSIGGKFDFDKALENEKQDFFLKGDIAYNKKDYAIYLWGVAVRNAGIKTSNEAQKLYEEIYEKELTTPEKKALKAGFSKK
jgi:hypothetical protein